MRPRIVEPDGSNNDRLVSLDLTLKNGSIVRFDFIKDRNGKCFMVLYDSNYKNNGTVEMSAEISAEDFLAIRSIVPTVGP